MQCKKDESYVCFLKTIKPLWESSPLGKMQALRHVFRIHRVNVHRVSQVCWEQPIDLGACESHFMAGNNFTTCFWESQTFYEVMKFMSHMPWSDFFIFFNQGNKPYPQDVKKEITKTELKKRHYGTTQNQERLAESNGWHEGHHKERTAEFLEA